ncbi:MAG: tRNA (adenosine(37)-N6)-threonylcarbamoyltransferase complex transferase subunit TsaD [Elusimicrobiota bacterium]
MRILGIETSCDETAVSILDEKGIVSESVFSQIDIHSRYGGVVPEIASREHLKKLNLIIEECLSNAGMGMEGVDAVAVTSRPGLEGSLLVGLMTARTISFLMKIPLIEVDHLEAHLFASAFTGLDDPPGIGLIISGGHSRLVYIKAWGDYEILGNTRDDAVGECFDKVASVLGLPYPGGPSIERSASGGDPDKFKFPVANMGGSYDFSYSGLKTAVLYKVKYDFDGKITEEERKNISASFQKAAFKPLLKNSIKAMEEFGANWLLVCGGVAANGELRRQFETESGKKQLKIVFPEKAHCTDNASMVAACGQFYLNRNLKT